MILMKTFGKNGRLGNQLFQVAFIKALASRFNQEWGLPQWKYLPYFNMEWKDDKDVDIGVVVREESFDYTPVEKESITGWNVDFLGYWQSLKYFADVWPKIKKEFKWKDGVVEDIFKRNGFKPSFTSWAVHVRLGDYVNNSNYYNLPKEYYTSIFKEHPSDIFYIFSDDYKTCRSWFLGYDNVEFAEGGNEIEHLILMSQFKNHVIANSSFSWWGAKLSELYYENTRVIRPDCLFSGKLAELYTGKDFYPDQWEVRIVNPLREIKTKINKLTGATVIIPVKYDHEDRKENLTLVVSYLLHHTNFEIIVGEQGGNMFSSLTGKVKYMQFDCEEFHRTKMINEMVCEASNEIIFNWDADILLPIESVSEALKMLNKGYEFVYPYDGTFAHVGREYYHQLYDTLSLDCLSGVHFRGMKEGHAISYGGCVAFNRSAFARVGFENENYVGNSPEDRDRAMRFRELGKMGRVDGPLYHIEHFRSPTSQRMNEFLVLNSSEIRKVENMTAAQLKKYVASWRWVGPYKERLK